MADLSSVVELVFRGIDQASGAANNVRSALQGVGKAADDVGKVAQPFADMADRLLLVQGAALALGGVMGALAYKEAVAFETSLLSLQKQLDESEGSAESYASKLEELGLKYGTNTNALVESAADFKAAGFDIQTSLGLVKQSLDLMIAGDITAAESTNILKNSLAGFQIPADASAQAAQRIADVLNKVADISQGGFKDLAQGFSDLAPIAKLTGFSFEEVAASLSVVIDKGSSGSEAANGLKSAFLSMASPSKEAATAMKDAGVAFNEAGKPIEGVKGIIESLIPAWAKMTEQKKLDFAATVAGKDQAGRFIALLDDWALVLERVAKAHAEAGGSIEKEVTIRLGSAQAVINRTIEAWRQLETALGNQIRVETTGVIQGLGDLAISFKNVVNSGGLDPLFDALRPQLAQLETLIKTVAQNLPDAFAGIDFSDMVKAFERLGVQAKGALEALFGPIDLDSVEGLRKAIQSVVDVFTGFINMTAGEVGGFKPLLEGLRQLSTAFKDAPSDVQGFAGELLSFGKTVSVLNGFIEPLNTALLAFLAFGPRLAGFATAATEVGVALMGPQGVAIGLGLLASEIIKFLVPADQLADYLWPDWLSGQEGTTPGTAIADIVIGFEALTGRIKEWLGVVEQVDPVVSKFQSSLERPIPVTSFDGAISQIARFEEEIKKNQETYENFFADLERPVPVSQWDGMLSKMDELAGKSDETRQQLETLTKGNEGGYSVRFNADGLIEISADANTLGKAFGELDGKVKSTADGFKYIEQVGANGERAFRQLGPSAFAASKEVTELEKAQRALGDAFGKSGADVGLITSAFSGYMNALGKSGSLTTDQFINLTKTVNDFKSKMEEIASNERLKTIEFGVQLETEKLKADVERVKAAFASIDSTIQSTGDLLGSLFGNLTDTDNRWKELEIQEQIDQENRRRQEALDLQKRLTEAEIARIEAQTEALNRGDALIRIEANGLEPELEAFMWKILTRIRTRANAEFADYLLGLGV